MSNHIKTHPVSKQVIVSKLKETVVELWPQDPETLSKIKKTEQHRYKELKECLIAYAAFMLFFLLPFVILLGAWGAPAVVASAVASMLWLLVIVPVYLANYPELICKKQINNFVSNPDKLIEAIKKASDKVKKASDKAMDDDKGYYQAVNLLVAIKRSKLENKWIKHMESLEGEELKNYFDKIPIDLSKHKRMTTKLWERLQNCRAVPVEAVLVETMTVEAKLVKRSQPFLAIFANNKESDLPEAREVTGRERENK